MAAGRADRSGVPLPGGGKERPARQLVSRDEPEPSGAPTVPVQPQSDSPNTGPSDTRFTSQHTLKGLESDVVVLVDVDENLQSRGDRQFYVASTRAQELLIALEATAG